MVKAIIPVLLLATLATLLGVSAVVATQGLPVREDKIDYLKSLAQVDSEKTQDNLVQKLLDDEIYVSESDFTRISATFFARQLFIVKNKLAALHSAIER